MFEPKSLAFRFALYLGGTGVIWVVLGVTPLLDPTFGTAQAVIGVVMFILPAIGLYALHRRNEAKGHSMSPNEPT